MQKEYIKIASIPEDEEIVSLVQSGGYHHYNLAYPFKHFIEPTYLVATKKAIYQINLK